jgi:REP element-mobilizing transposase RayT
MASGANVVDDNGRNDLLAIAPTQWNLGERLQISGDSIGKSSHQIETFPPLNGPLAKDEIERGFLGWHENGYLPHRDEPGLVQFVTFRMADAFPAELRSEWEALLKIEDDRKRRIELEAYLDQGRGECHLRRADIAAMVEGSLLFRHDVQYELRAWVIMPNHVHLLFLVQDVPMSQLVDAWKGYTAKEANKILGRKGQFWQEGYWDTYMRDSAHELRSRRYIEKNPVKAFLVKDPKDWPWSSAGHRDEHGELCL